MEEKEEDEEEENSIISYFSPAAILARDWTNFFTTNTNGILASCHLA